MYRVKKGPSSPHAIGHCLNKEFSLLLVFPCGTGSTVQHQSLLNLNPFLPSYLTTTNPLLANSPGFLPENPQIDRPLLYSTETKPDQHPMAAPLDAKVAAVLSHSKTENPDELDEDALLEALENEDDTAYRAHRLEQLHKELASAKQAHARNAAATTSTNTTSPSAIYPTLPNDKAVLDLTTNNERCIIHFFHPDFARCAIMDQHLQTLATLHYEVRIARVDVRECPFLVEKLGVRVLPCVICFLDGVGKDRVIGFEGLATLRKGRNGVDNFSTKELESRFLMSKLFVRGKLADAADAGDFGGEESDSEEEERRRKKQVGGRGIRDGTARRRNNNDDDDDDDDDWD